MRRKAVPSVLVVERLTKSFLKVRDFKEVLLSIRWIAWIVALIPFMKCLLRRDEVLKDVSFEVPQGSVFGLFGVNGSGKTTLLYCMINLLMPESGRILVHGKNVRSLGAALGTVFAKCNRSELYPSFTIMENVEFIARLHGLDPKEAREAARVFLNIFGVQPEEQDCKQIKRLSVGTRSKAALICGLIPLLRPRSEEESPPILLLDEPTLGFDVGSVEKFFAAIRSLRDTIPKLTIIIATNDVREAGFCDDYIALADGNVVYKPEELKHLRCCVDNYREPLESFARAIGQEFTNGNVELRPEEVPSSIALAKRHSPFLAFGWRMMIDMKRHPLLIALVVLSIVVPNLLGLFASTGSRGVWPALVMTVFGVYLSLSAREGFRFYGRELNWYNSLELVLSAPVTRRQHFIASAVQGGVWDIFYALLSGALLYALLYDRTAADLRHCVANLTLEASLGILVILLISAFAARILGLMVSLTPFVTRPEQAYFLMMMVPTLLVVCGGIFSSPDTLPVCFIPFAELNPITYGSAALIEFLHFDFGSELAATEWLVETAPSLSRPWANVSILAFLSTGYLIIAGIITYYAEAFLRKNGKLRAGVQ